MEGAAEPLPISFRYEISATVSLKTNIFKPNDLNLENPSTDTDSLKSQTIGAVLKGMYNKCNGGRRASLVWEAGASHAWHSLILGWHSWQVTYATAPVAKIVPVKPKVYVTCSFVIPAQSWCKLTE